MGIFFNSLINKHSDSFIFIKSKMEDRIFALVQLVDLSFLFVKDRYFIEKFFNTHDLLLINSFNKYF